MTAVFKVGDRVCGYIATDDITYAGVVTTREEFIRARETTPRYEVCVRLDSPTIDGREVVAFIEQSLRHFTNADWMKYGRAPK